MDRDIAFSSIIYLKSFISYIESGKFVLMLKKNWNAENFNLINVY